MLYDYILRLSKGTMLFTGGGTISKALGPYGVLEPVSVGETGLGLPASARAYYACPISVVTIGRRQRTRRAMHKYATSTPSSMA